MLVNVEICSNSLCNIAGPLVHIFRSCMKVSPSQHGPILFSVSWGVCLETLGGIVAGVKSLAHGHFWFSVFNFVHIPAVGLLASPFNRYNT